MKTRMVEERIGENMGPVDWTHDIAKDKPAIWREAEKHPERFRYVENGGFFAKPIIALAMYDGWPYWTPRPAIHFMGTLGPEWTFFDSYGVSDRSIFEALPRENAAERRSGGDGG